MFQHVCHLNNTSGLMAHLIYFKETSERSSICALKVQYIFDYIKLHNGAQKVESQGREETPDSSMNISDAEQGSGPRREPEGTSARPNLPTAPSACPGHRPVTDRCRAHKSQIACVFLAQENSHATIYSHKHENICV